MFLSTISRMLLSPKDKLIDLLGYRDVNTAKCACKGKWSDAHMHSPKMCVGSWTPPTPPAGAA